MMAAMGQQDCGQCGYDCKQYADAIFQQVRRAAETSAFRAAKKPPGC